MANNYTDLSTSTVLTAPSPATSGTSLVVQSGHGTRFASTQPFYAIAHPEGTFPTIDNSEAVLVTNISTDTFTITRAQLGTSAKSIAVGWRISGVITALIPQATVDGWVSAIGETWTYASALTYTNTNTTRGGTFTISGDKTGKYSVGMKIKFTQSTGGTKYGCIVAISYSNPNTTVTVFLGTDYTLNNEAISSPYYSMVDTPHGFPKDPTKWTLQTLSTTQRSTTSTSWVSLTDSLSTPPGAFNLQLLASVMVLVAANVHRFLSLSLSSDASTPESDFIAIPGYTDNVTNDRTGGAINLSKPIFVSAATTWTVIGKVNSSSVEGYVANGGANGPTVIRATPVWI